MIWFLLYLVAIALILALFRFTDEQESDSREYKA